MIDRKDDKILRIWDTKLQESSARRTKETFKELFIDADVLMSVYLLP